jgi:hypothetical protein
MNYLANIQQMKGSFSIYNSKVYTGSLNLKLVLYCIIERDLVSLYFITIRIPANLANLISLTDFSLNTRLAFVVTIRK